MKSGFSIVLYVFSIFGYLFSFHEVNISQPSTSTN